MVKVKSLTTAKTKKLMDQKHSYFVREKEQPLV